MAATVFFYAISYPLGAIALHDIAPFLLIALRFAITALLMWGIVIGRRMSVPRGKELGMTAMAGLGVQGVQFLGLYWGMSHGVSAGIAALVIAMNPVATALINGIFFGLREDKWGIAALVLGATGVVAACLPRLLAHTHTGPALIVTFLALGGLAVGSIAQARFSSHTHPVAFTAVGVTVSLPPALLLASLTPVKLLHPYRSIGLILLLTACSALAMVLYASVVRSQGARTAASLFALIPAVAVLAAWWLQGTVLDASVALALVLGCAACICQSNSGGHSR